MPANLDYIARLNSQPDVLAIAFRRFPPTGTHVGIVYRVADGTHRLLHLADHRRLWDEPDDPDSLSFAPASLGSFVCVTTPFQRPEAIALAGYCRLIHETNVGRNTI